MLEGQVNEKAENLLWVEGLAEGDQGLFNTVESSKSLVARFSPLK